jgi:hypothetical protein
MLSPPVVYGTRAGCGEETLVYRGYGFCRKG